MVHYRAEKTWRHGRGAVGGAGGGERGRRRAHLMISCSRCSSWRWRIMTPSMMARSSGVRCDRSGMSAMACGGAPRAVAGPPRAAVLYPQAILCAPLRSEVYLIMPDGPMARSRLLTSATLLIATRAACPHGHQRAGVKPPAPSLDRCVRIRPLLR